MNISAETTKNNVEVAVEVAINDEDFRKKVHLDDKTDETLVVVGFLIHDYDESNNADPLKNSLQFLAHFANALECDISKFKIVLFNVHANKGEQASEEDQEPSASPSTSVAATYEVTDIESPTFFIFKKGQVLFHTAQLHQMYPAKTQAAKTESSDSEPKKKPRKRRLASATQKLSAALKPSSRISKTKDKDDSKDKD